MPDPVNLEYLRKEAKKLLKQCRAKDPEAIARVCAQLPNLAPEDAKLADVQHSLAREQGYANWAALKHADQPIERFLAAVRNISHKNAQDELERFPDLAECSLHAACALGDVDAARGHLDLNPGSLEAEQGGWTPLLYACASWFPLFNTRYAFGVREWAELLLDRGADCTKVPALQRAARIGNRLVMQLLIQRGAKMGPGFPGNLESEITEKAPPHFQVLMSFLSDPSYREELAGRMAPFRERRSEVFKKGVAQMTAKDWMEFGQGDEAKFRDSALVTSQLALERGLDPNLPCTPAGETMLHRCARTGETALAELFLTRGANPNAATTAGVTPYAYAIQSGHEEVAALLLKHGARPGTSASDDLLGACRRIDVDRAREIVRQNPGVLDALGPEGRKLLVSSVKDNNLRAVHLMADLGFDLSAFVDGATPLHLAAWHGYAEMVQRLLEFRAPVNIADGVYGTSPLGWAAHGSKHNPYANDDSYCEVVRELIDNGADYAASVNRSGVGPEAIASPRVVEAFRERGFLAPPCEALKGGRASRK